MTINPIHWRPQAGRRYPQIRQGGQAILRLDLVGNPPAGPPVAGYSQWLYAGSGTDGVNDGDAVGSWAGQGASPFTVTQATAGKKPLLKLAVQNGLPVIRFDGVDDGLKAVVALSQPMTVFIAYRMIARPPTGQKYVLGQGDQLDFVSNTDTQIRIYGGGTQVTATDSTQTVFRISTGVLNSQAGGNSYLFLNGIQLGSGNIGPNGLTTFRICNYADGNTNNANADMGEILIYPSALSDPNRQLVEAWLIQRWGIVTFSGVTRSRLINAAGQGSQGRAGLVNSGG